MDTREAFGQRLEAARIAAGGPSYRSLEREAIRAIGFAPSNTTIAKYHQGQIDPSRANLELVVWLAERYDVLLSDLSETLGARLNGARDVLIRSTGWFLPSAA